MTSVLIKDTQRIDMKRKPGKMEASTAIEQLKPPEVGRGNE